MRKKICMLLAALLTACSVISAGAGIVSADEDNESVIYHYLTEDAGYSGAAAAGIMGNLYQESKFDPTISSTSSYYYGLVQWGSWRKTALFDYCASIGYDATSLAGQLRYLTYELEGSYSDVGDYLKNVPDTAEGAYDAADYFCRYFEICGNYDWEVPTRGGFAQGFFADWAGDGETPDEEVEDVTDQVAAN